MLTRIKRVLIGLAIILAVFFAKAFYEEYQSHQRHQQELEMMRHPKSLGIVIDPDGTIRGDGYVIRP